APAHGAKGTGRGVSARSGWRVNTARSSRNRFRAVPRTDTPRPVPAPPPTPAVLVREGARDVRDFDPAAPYASRTRTAGRAV
ncbi:hypothetical protein AB0H86_40125, partial [Streptomyces sp. NPDC050997]|uniref:hypothetical protein n=1 Tax=Streptomyces sp. NPDC050997 TaxID=3155519 RepID=UPI0034244E68